MLNLDVHQNKIKYLLIALTIILVALVVGLLYKANREIKTENQQTQIAIPENEVNLEPLTQEQLSNAAKKAEGKDIIPLTPEQLKKAAEPAK